MSNDAIIKVPSDVAAQIEARVASGSAADAGEVIRAGLVSLEAEDARKLALVREKIAAALADTRPSAPADEVFDRLEAMLDGHRRA